MIIFTSISLELFTFWKFLCVFYWNDDTHGHEETTVSVCHKENLSKAVFWKLCHLSSCQILWNWQHNEGIFFFLFFCLGIFCMQSDRYHDVSLDDCLALYVKINVLWHYRGQRPVNRIVSWVALWFPLPIELEYIYGPGINMNEKI